MRARAEEHASGRDGWLGRQHSEQRSLELLEASLRLARESDASADVLMRCVIVANVFDPPLGDASVLDEVVRRFAEMGDAEGEALARLYVIRRHLLEGRIGAMRFELDGFERRAKALRLPHLIASATSARAALALLEGRLDDAEALARKAYDLGDQSGMQEAEIHFQRRSEVILWLRGRFAELEVVARRKARHLPEAMKVECSRVALAAALVGRSETMDEGRALFRDMVPRGLDPDVFGATRSCCLVALADVCWTLEDAEGAAALYDVVLPFRGTVAGRGISTPRGATDRSLGQLAALLGRYEDAERQFEEGHRRHRAMGARVWLGLGLADHAVMLALRGRGGGDTRTRRLLSDAVDVFTELGLEFHQRRMRSMMQQLGGGSSASTPDGSTIVRHGDAWTVVHEGRQTRLRDSKGVRYLAELLAHPGRRFHSLELLAGDLADTDGEESVPGVDARAPADAERARQSVTKVLRSTAGSHLGCRSEPRRPPRRRRPDGHVRGVRAGPACSDRVGSRSRPSISRLSVVRRTTPEPRRRVRVRAERTEHDDLRIEGMAQGAVRGHRDDMCGHDDQRTGAFGAGDRPGRRRRALRRGGLPAVPAVHRQRQPHRGPRRRPGEHVRDLGAGGARRRRVHARVRLRPGVPRAERRRAGAAHEPDDRRRAQGAALVGWSFGAFNMQLYAREDGARAVVGMVMVDGTPAQWVEVADRFGLPVPTPQQIPEPVDLRASAAEVLAARRSRTSR